MVSYIIGAAVVLWVVWILAACAKVVYDAYTLEKWKLSQPDLRQEWVSPVLNKLKAEDIPRWRRQDMFPLWMQRSVTRGNEHERTAREWWFGRFNQYRRWYPGKIRPTERGSAVVSSSHPRADG